MRKTIWLIVPLLFLFAAPAFSTSPAGAQDQPSNPASRSNKQASAAQDQLEKETTWNLADDRLVVESINEWLNGPDSDPTLFRPAVEAFQQSGPEIDASTSWANNRFDRLIAAISSARPDVAKITQQLSKQSQSVLPPTFSHILDNDSEHPFVRNHVRLLFGRWLVQNKFYDESLSELSQIELKNVLAPELVLFYRSLAEHQLLKTDACTRTIEQLLENEEQLPARFSVVAKMMLADISPVKEGSLDEISRMMKDIQRRTRFLRSGTIVLETEKQVIDKLDKLIDEAEKKQQQQQQSQSQSQPANGNQQGSKPMDDTKIAGGSGDGKVTNKSIQDGGQWGDLPAAERAAAMAEMVKDMPPHYRSAIEQYFKRLAKEDSP